MVATPWPLYPRERQPVHIVREAGSENLAPIGNKSPDRPGHKESLYRLSHLTVKITCKTYVLMAAKHWNISQRCIVAGEELHSTGPGQDVKCLRDAMCHRWTHSVFTLLICALRNVADGAHSVCLCMMATCAPI